MQCFREKEPIFGLFLFFSMLHELQRTTHCSFVPWPQPDGPPTKPTFLFHTPPLHHSLSRCKNVCKRLPKFFSNSCLVLFLGLHLNETHHLPEATKEFSTMLITSCFFYCFVVILLPHQSKKCVGTKNIQKVEQQVVVARLQQGSRSSLISCG